MASRTKCEKCSMTFQGFHICIDISPEEKATTEYKGRRSYSRAASDYQTSEENIEKLREATIQRHAATRLLNSSRDRKIIEEYKAGGIGVRALAAKYGTSHTTVIKILHAAKVPMRSRGRTVARGA